MSDFASVHVTVMSPPPTSPRRLTSAPAPSGVKSSPQTPAGMSARPSITETASAGSPVDVIDVDAVTCVSDVDPPCAVHVVPSLQVVT
jgi:hypothetical protein